MFLTVLAAKFRILVPKYIWHFKGEDVDADHELEQAPTVKQFALAWTPYLAIAVLLLVTRMSAFGLKDILKGSASTFTTSSVSKAWTLRFSGRTIPGFSPSYWWHWSPPCAAACR